jgi:hypothetical protein
MKVMVCFVKALVFYFNIQFLPLVASIIVWVQLVRGSWPLGPISEMSKIPTL